MEISASVTTFGFSLQMYPPGSLTHSSDSLQKFSSAHSSISAYFKLNSIIGSRCHFLINVSVNVSVDLVTASVSFPFDLKLICWLISLFVMHLRLKIQPFVS